jgi:hypothetical protein
MKGTLRILKTIAIIILVEFALLALDVVIEGWNSQRFCAGFDGYSVCHSAWDFIEHEIGHYIFWNVLTLGFLIWGPLLIIMVGEMLFRQYKKNSIVKN